MNESTLTELTLPICDAVIEFYRERFNTTNVTTGKLDLFPAQVSFPHGSNEPLSFPT
eukprot:COSAG03_NODE_5266_length_1293_cov_7.826633_1_plen_57_part_00